MFPDPSSRLRLPQPEADAARCVGVGVAIPLMLLLRCVLQAATMADAAFQGGAKVGAVKAVMRRLQRGAHKGEQARGAASRLSSVSKARGAEVAKKKGEPTALPQTHQIRSQTALRDVRVVDTESSICGSDASSDFVCQALDQTQPFRRLWKLSARAGSRTS